VMTAWFAGLVGCDGGAGNRCAFCGCPGSPCDLDASQGPYDARGIADAYGIFAHDVTAGDERAEGGSDTLDAAGPE